MRTFRSAMAVAGISLLVGAGAAQASTSTCRFDTDACGFVLFEGDPKPVTTLVSGGRMIFHTMGQVYDGEPPQKPYDHATAEETYIHETLVLPYDEDWTAELTANVPAEPEPDFKQGVTEIEHLMLLVCVGVGYFLPDDSFYNMSMCLVVWADTDNLTKKRVYDGSASFHEPTTEVPTEDETGVVGIRFDATTKVLTAFYADGDLLSVDIDAPNTDWGMSVTDVFNLAFSLGARGLPVPEATPLAVDDVVVRIPPCPWDCGGDNDGNVGIVDFLELLAQWNGGGSCDFDGGGVSIVDFLELLANWGACP